MGILSYSLCLVSYSTFLFSTMYRTTPKIIAPNAPNCTPLMLFHPNTWLSISTIAERTMMIIPRFFKNPFIILIYLFCLVALIICKETQYSSHWKIKMAKSSFFFAIETALYSISLYLLLSISLMTFSQLIFEVRE